MLESHTENHKNMKNLNPIMQMALQPNDSTIHKTTNSRSILKLFASAVVVLMLGSQPSNAALLNIQYTDPVGDALLDSPDWTSLSMTFDTANGNYTIVVTADPDKPFV